MKRSHLTTFARFPRPLAGQNEFGAAGEQVTLQRRQLQSIALLHDDLFDV
jgi:hypothetical protein